MGMTQEYFHTISTSCAILPTMPCVVGSKLVVLGVLVHVDMHAWRVSGVVGCCNLIATENGRHDRYVQSYIQRMWS